MMLARTITGAAQAARGTRFEVRPALLAALAVCLCCALAAAPALASTVHKYSGEFGTPGGGSAAGDFSGPAGIATDSSGNLFVAEQWSNRVQELADTGEALAVWTGSNTPNGYFGGPFGVAVDSANDRVYVSEQWGWAVDVMNGAGGFVEQLASPSGYYGFLSNVAVDTSTGDVFVADQGAGAIDMFNASGAAVGSFGSPGSEEGQLGWAFTVAVDSSSHEVYVADQGNGRVDRFSEAGVLEGTLSGVQSPLAVAVDPENGDVYVGEYGANGPQVSRYSSAGSRIEEFGGGRIGGIGGLAVSPTGHRVYVSDNGNQTIDVFGPVSVPTVTTGTASGVGATEATLSGEVNTENTWVYFPYFEYGLSTGYGSQAQVWEVFPPASTPASASTMVAGLEPNATYHFRLVAENMNGKGYGADETFTTAAAPPSVDGTYAAPVSPETAVLRARINANNSPTGYRFEYGTTTGYGSSTAEASAGSGYGDVDAPAEITGLSPDTVYHFRAIAQDGVGGPVVSADKTFKTAPAAPPTATEVTGVTATLNGVLDPQGVQASYHFEYGTTTSYGANSAEASVEAGEGDEPVSLPISGLEAGTIYHFRLVSSSNGNTTVTADGTFTTIPAATVSVGAAGDLAPTSATVNGTLDTYGQPATYHFTVTSVGGLVRRLTPDRTLTSEGPAGVSDTVEDLPAGTEYQVVLTATVAGAQSTSEPATFTTPNAAAIVPRTLTPESNPYSGLSPTPPGAVSTPPSSAGASFVLLSARAKGTVATITVTVPAAGTLTVNGHYLQTTSKTVSKAGVCKLTGRLTKAAARKLRHKHKLRAGFLASFTAGGTGTASSHTGTVTFERKAGK